MRWNCSIASAVLGVTQHVAEIKKEKGRFSIREAARLAYVIELRLGRSQRAQIGGQLLGREGFDDIAFL